MISALLGGIGLFLLGMVLMTEGLKAAAGGKLRDVLGRFTGGPLTAFASGAGLTALVQSSSATIVTTIGFVSAGLLTFTQAVGVIFGAAVGTTSTGWLVAFLGLKYSVSALALPLVGVGALLRLLGRGRASSAGLIVAGFGLIFVGIDTLQIGMQHLSARIDLSGIDAAGLWGRAFLIAIGIVMTVVMQSSSAAVATTLAALHAGTIGLTQAAVLVIGQNIGTTVTAALAALGASVPARRTALAHIFLNTFSGVIALAMLPLHLMLIGRLEFAFGIGAAAGIAVFHTTFNLIGVGLLLPFTGTYARLLERLLPEQAPRFTRFLDASVRRVPTVAVEAARRTLNEIAAVAVRAAQDALSQGALTHSEKEAIGAAERALSETREFLSTVRSSPDSERDHTRHLSVLHATDHLERLLSALERMPPPGWLHEDASLAGTAADASLRLEVLARWLEHPDGSTPDQHLEDLSQSIAEARRAQRPHVMANAAAGEFDPATGLRILDAMRWIDRMVYHLWRATHHLAAGGGQAEPDAFAEHSTEIDPEDEFATLRRGAS